MFVVGDKVRVIANEGSHFASVGDKGVVVEVENLFDKTVFLVEFEDKLFPNGGGKQLLHLHELNYETGEI